ncbi:ATP-binding cassette domain-containing protein [Conexibacter sp. JD483]|uniref:ABC transporter ATP-binding protein n=1 Tax=unclassified Conexibacter TaxID=2627773 RepID=UPI00272149CB|nr:MULTISPECIES: ATP-binding cassette domain-containing protein [unclassified Conexibacter]MDO8186103.1 ATP-binding cassette domain-containing protein [Conexibacter sp. CPCC 205706]MDO8199593.1 ATP-binding cassette domain-containing protein [Conexibacter sp. CPCC 205762]MDR9371864.1 ATP-binding cassette domain-containing protein [Conexibacter sp. JD483]
MTRALDLTGVSLWRWDAEQQRERHLLRDVHWTVNPGEHWALLGANGAGKTTLMNVAAAVHHPSDGTADVLGERLGRVDLRALRGRIGLVEARTSRSFRQRLTAEQVVLTGATATIALRPGALGDDERERASGLLARFGCGELADRPYDACSQGERQRVLLARALMRRPALLLLDEPATGLDLPGREALLQAVATIAREEPETATVTVTHHVEELAPSTTHALLLRDGAVVAAGAAEQTISGANLTATFDTPVRVDRVGGRWLARAEAHW